MKAKIILTVILIAGLLVLASLLVGGIVLSFVLDIKWGTHGWIAIASFILAAIIFGKCLNGVINRIKILWRIDLR